MARRLTKPLAERNRGAMLLIATRIGDAKIAERCGCSKAAVGHWKSGARKPSADLRVMLERFFGVPRSAWDEPATHADVPRGSRFGALRKGEDASKSHASPTPSPRRVRAARAAAAS